MTAATIILALSFAGVCEELDAQLAAIKGAIRPALQQPKPPAAPGVSPP